MNRYGGVLPAYCQLFLRRREHAGLSLLTNTTMLTEAMLQQALSGGTCNNFVRYIFACIGGVIAEPLIAAVGNGWLVTGLGARGSCGVQ